jgi:hypothetical protein
MINDLEDRSFLRERREREKEREGERERRIQGFKVLCLRVL